MRHTKNTADLRRYAAGTALVVGLSLVAGKAIADDTPVSMAPPVGRAVSIGTYSPNSSVNTSEDTVFKFTEVPSGDQIPIKRAVFDQGGYQLFDMSGQTIVVPFDNQNLYVMKFGVSPDAAMYFVNDDGTPTLYVPQNGYLENATVPGAKWYPFSNSFRPTSPVYLGAAPSYTQYVNTGWYPNSTLYGGYYCPTSFLAGGVFQPTYGLTFVIGNQRYLGWNAYYNRLNLFPAPYHIGFFNRPIYTVITHSRPSRPAFQGSYNRWRPGEVRRPSFTGNNPRYTGENRDRNRFGRPNGDRPSFNNSDRPTGDIYRNPSGTYRFTGNPGASFSDPRRVPNVNIGNQDPGRQPFRNNPVNAFQQRPSVQNTMPGMNVFNRSGYNSGSSFQNRPNYNSPSFGSGFQNNRPNRDSFSNRPSFGGGNNNSRPSMNSGSQNRSTPGPIMRPSAGRNMGAPDMGRRPR